MCFLFRMGQLLSRIFKRLSSSSGTANQQQQQHNTSEATTSKDHGQNSRQTVQSIPVGQSIDSAEYTALAQQAAHRPKEQEKGEILTPGSDGSPAGGAQVSKIPKTDVEEAAIKIQALIRGHLTRKALKDGNNQQQNSFSSLGQSQFDQEALVDSAPAAVFQPSSPLSSVAGQLRLHVGGHSSLDASANSRPPPLESIAEQPGDAPTSPARPVSPGMRARLNQLKSANRSSSSPSKLEMPNRPNSPLGSENGASIDLGGGSVCGTPASASVSIDISDHNIVENERMASVLHHNTPTDPEADNSNTESSLINSNSCQSMDNNQNEHRIITTTCQINEENQLEEGLSSSANDNEEQAAIRIQSAFRGYRTRKSSPYRKVSPCSKTPSTTNTTGMGQSADQNLNSTDSISNDEGPVHEQELVGVRADEDKPEEVAGPPKEMSLLERRQSRARERLEQAAAEQKSIDAQSLASMDEPTVISSIGLNNQQQQQLAEDNELDTDRSLSVEASKPALESAQESSFASRPGEDDTTHASDLNGQEDDFTAALEGVKSTSFEEPTAENQEDLVVEACDQEAGRRQSDISNDVTDSSLLGAALSLNEEPSQPEVPEELEPEPEPELDMAQIEAEAERLVRELDASISTPPPPVEEPPIEKLTVDELESDDIERRDPSGRQSAELAAEVRELESKNQTRTEPDDGDVQIATSQDNDQNDDGRPKAQGAASGSEGDAKSSASSSRPQSPSSSGGRSSSGDSRGEKHSDEQEGDGRQQQQSNKPKNNNQNQHQQPQSKSGNKNKNRNKNKRKGGGAKK